MNSVLLLCFVVLLASTNAEFPELSGSFSFQGSRVSTGISLVTTNPRYNVYNDISRGLQLVDSMASLLFFTSSTVQVASVNDSAEYSNTGDTCVRTITDSLDISPFSVYENPWDIFRDSIESPPGTFSITNQFSIYRVVIVDGYPSEYSEILTVSTSIITITSYIDEAPAFSAFRLPEDCIQYDCTACPEGVRSSAGTIAITSWLLMLAAMAMVLI